MVDSVELLGGLGFAGKVHEFRRFRLHSKGQFKGLNARFEGGVGSGLMAQVVAV